MAVEHIYSITGRGTVATGKIEEIGSKNSWLPLKKRKL